MRRLTLALLLAGTLLAAPGPAIAHEQSAPSPNVVLDKAFDLDPNDDSRFATDCFDAPYGTVLTVVVWTLDDDTNGERVNFAMKEGSRVRLQTTLTTNPTISTAYAGAGTYCYWLAASHIHLDQEAPIRHARLTITTDPGDGAGR